MKTLRMRVATRLGLLPLVLIAGSIGCASIVGADDYMVGAVGEGTAGTSNGQSGSDIGTGGTEDFGGSDTPGAGGMIDNRRDASAPIDATVPKPESSVTPPKADAAKPDVFVPDTGTGGKPVGSGETLCTTTCAGAGLTCQHTNLGNAGICSYLCNDVSECDIAHDCIGSSDPASDFNYACVKKCSAAITCPNGLSCVPLSSGSVCLPTEWLPHDLGLGDDCVQDEQCTSHQCANKPRGWCSRPCRAYDGTYDYCEGDYFGGSNYYDEFNSCVSVLGGYKCTPGCNNDSTVCSIYPGTTCRDVIDIDGYNASVCAP